MSSKSKSLATAASGAKTGTVVIAQPQVLSVALEVAGTADLIQNCYSQKSIEQMLRNHMGISVQREKKKPRESIEHATIRNTAGAVCLSPVAFKAAMISASAALKTLKKTQLRTSLFVEGASIPITFAEMRPRMDMVRTSGIGRKPDVRFRPSFVDWKACMVIQFSDTLTVQTVVDLLNRAGSVGVGEWRPEKNGVYGTFRVSRNITDTAEIRDLRTACAVPLVTPVIPEWALDADIDPEMLAKIFDDHARSNGASEAEA